VLLFTVGESTVTFVTSDLLLYAATSSTHTCATVITIYPDSLVRVYGSNPPVTNCPSTTVEGGPLLRRGFVHLTNSPMIY
jgi:hypothetical protein